MQVQPALDTKSDTRVYSCEGFVGEVKAPPRSNAPAAGGLSISLWLPPTERSTGPRAHLPVFAGKGATRHVPRGTKHHPRGRRLRELAANSTETTESGTREGD